MAPQDADMPDHQALSEDIQEITNHINKLREELESLTGSIARAGGHQVENLQDQASEALTAVSDAVKRDPLTSLGIALGVGLLLGIVLRR